MAKKDGFKEETFGVSWHLYEVFNEARYQTGMLVSDFYYTVTERFEGKGLDKTITKARLMLTSNKKTQHKIKKGFGLRVLWCKKNEYGEAGWKIALEGKQKISEAKSEEEKQDIINDYGQRCADNRLKFFNVYALACSKADPNVDYVEQRDRWQKTCREETIPNYYLNGKVFKNALV